MAFEEFEGKNVYINIETKDGTRRYSGILKEVTYLGKTLDKVDNYFLLLVDKFGQNVGFASSQIKLIEEEK